MTAHNIVDQYLTGLEEHLTEEDQQQLAYTSGAGAAALQQLQDRFPACPESLLYLLSRINGTYWQQYGEHEVCVLMLGSDVYEYPYYLKSVAQILEEKSFDRSINEVYGAYLEEMPELIGAGIDPDINIREWLCFSDCMNNGGTSQLFIDFNPGPGGTKGQVIRFLHDPDSFAVIAGSFDEYLQQLMEQEYAFIIPEEDEEDEE
ncbi:SMI1/KNR4 family protein [Taibaiella chishuiensis]|uniref:SMI1/KNR4 family protein SUKH-1 n=1 Tax=Taibaiella chishuiensis TaxID=1434707 RepID=A0A2P8D1T7_9BACT|nr:SMI1/KNR4 family protein [Taibaiella chishuiensis]PSK91190.1 SMI1/KNR4 family protein SUKH-1 [Taibaiella chishuiensis]